MLGRISLARLIRPLRALRSQYSASVDIPRNFHGTLLLRNSNFFGQLTSNKESETSKELLKEAEDVKAEDVTPSTDKSLQEYYLAQAKKEQILSSKYIHPLKKKLFDRNVAKNGFYKNNEVMKDPDTGKFYKLSLTPKEIELLEPSIYLQSYRIKSSMKKATVVNRFVRGFNVKHAINQLHFNPKKMATELEKLLKTGLAQARDMNLNEDELYIQALWVGSDGDWPKRLDPKGRGRSGVIRHRYVHLKAVLRSGVTKKRLQWEKEQKLLLSKPRMFLNNEPLNFRVQPFYKW